MFLTFDLLLFVIYKFIWLIVIKKCVSLFSQLEEYFPMQIQQTRFEICSSAILYCFNYKHFFHADCNINIECILWSLIKCAFFVNIKSENSLHIIDIFYKNLINFINFFEYWCLMQFSACILRYRLSNILYICIIKIFHSNEGYLTWKNYV